MKAIRSLHRHVAHCKEWWRVKPTSGRLRVQIHWLGFVWSGLMLLCIVFMGISGAMLLVPHRAMPSFLETHQIAYLSAGTRAVYGVLLLALTAFAVRKPILGGYICVGTFSALGTVDALFSQNVRGVIFWAIFCTIAFVKQHERTTLRGWP